ncbi:HK97-gp10 family putative phage morphogenesis protein [Metabacillus sp. 84]|uniref:HK97-gp10 family putative phage morphogenesis protein n=1 Tax=Metabacillus sp. 84 TaxID=3404705 RepID=UPI003CE6A00C
MSVQVDGLNKLLNELEKRYGKERMQEISDEALKSGAAVFVNELKKEFQAFKDTGASLEEITLSDPMSISGVRTIKVHWSGPNNRYRIIHLNEFGTVKNPNPRGKGAIAKALRNAETAYKNAIRDSIRRGV